MSGEESMSSSETSKKRQWILPSVLGVATLSVGAWAIPHVQSAHTLADGAASSYVSPQPVQIPSAVHSSVDSQTATLTQTLDQILDSLPDGNVTGLVVDKDSGEVLYQRGSEQQRVPASNLKILVDYALLERVDPTERYETSVRRQNDVLTLVAGGDTLLGTGLSRPDDVVGHAGLRTLAQEVVQGLSQGPSHYRVNLDTSIYRGPSVNPAWAQGDIDAGEVTAVSPIAFYSHYSPDAQGNASHSRPAEAGQEVHRYFVSLLNELGAQKNLSFSLGEEEPATENSERIAQVSSATVAEQAAYMMQHSDNMLAETLGRNLAVSLGREGSFEQARASIQETLEQNGIDTAGFHPVDICGLSGENKVTNRMIVQVLEAIADSSAHTTLALDGFPVAGGSGTLALRFNSADTRQAQGYARAKTGTLYSVISLSGYGYSASGKTLVYSFITNDITRIDGAKETLDRAVTALVQR